MNEFALKRRHIFSVLLSMFLFTLICAATVDQCMAQGKQTNSTKKVPTTTTTAPAKPAATKPWFSFTGPDGDFTLSFPSEPNRMLDTRGPKTAIRAYKITTKDGMFFSVSYQDIGSDSISKEANEFGQDYEKAIEAGYRKRGDKVVQISRLAKNVIETELWIVSKITGDNLHRFERAVIKKGRLYTLGCGSIIDDVKANNAVCRKFLDSMRLIN